MNLKTYNSEYYTKNRIRILKNRKLRYKTDDAYREILMKKANEVNTSMRELVRVLKTKFGVETIEEVVAYAKKLNVSQSKKRK